jgi:hypothetical protein
MSKDDFDDYDVPSHTDSSERIIRSSTGRKYSSEAVDAFKKAAEEREKKTGVVGPDPDVLMKDRVITIEGENALLIAMDNTGSSYEEVLLLRTYMKTVWGNAIAYLKSLSLLLGFVGDAFSDHWPLQMIDPMVAGDIHVEMLKLHQEGGGGAPWRESYNLMAYAILKNVRVKTKNKPFLIFLADEAFYERTTAREIEKFVGGQGEDMDSFAIFRELRKIFHVVLIHLTYGDESLDKLILEQWAKAIGAQSIVVLKDPNALADDIVGVISLISGARDLDGYVADMKERGQDPPRIAEVSKALGPLSESVALVPIKGDMEKAPPVVRRRRTRKEEAE